MRKHFYKATEDGDDSFYEDIKECLSYLTKRGYRHPFLTEDEIIERVNNDENVLLKRTSPAESKIFFKDSERTYEVLLSKMYFK